jgi:hypothetical protein
MISLKAGVSLKDLQPQIVLAMLIVNELLVAKGIKFIITSCNDSTHMKGSLHYKGLAFDTRTHDITLLNRGGYLTSLRDEIKVVLGDEFDVILEDLQGPNEHMHVEFDPKPIAEKLPS